jgi:hypothetical protein
MCFWCFSESLTGRVGALNGLPYHSDGFLSQHGNGNFHVRKLAIESVQLDSRTLFPDRLEA